ncbi:MAG: hypothetical protein ACE5G2_12650, partial [Candidatus Krumholzibacteriia bacterium]
HHPDRNAGDTVAEEKFKAINVAYDHVMRPQAVAERARRRREGQAERARKREAEAEARRRREVAAEQARRRQQHVAASYGQGSNTERADPPASSGAPGAAGLAAAAEVAPPWAQQPPPVMHPPPPMRHRRRRHPWRPLLHWSLGMLALGTAVGLVLWINPGDVRPRVEESLAWARARVEVPLVLTNHGHRIGDTLQRPATSNAPWPDPGPRLFTLGSPSARVRTVQGAPARIKGNTWFYGSSWVDFQAGRVVGYGNGSGNLRVKLVPRAEPAEVGGFGKGSTEDEVLAVQGMPDRVVGDTWTYGVSWVRFDSGRVRKIVNHEGNLKLR